MINNNKNQKIKSYLYLYRGNKALIQKIFACTILTSVLLQHQNCDMNQNFENTKITVQTFTKTLTEDTTTNDNKLDVLLIYR